MWKTVCNLVNHMGGCVHIHSIREVEFIFEEFLMGRITIHDIAAMGEDHPDLDEAWARYDAQKLEDRAEELRVETALRAQASMKPSRRSVEGSEKVLAPTPSETLETPPAGSLEPVAGMPDVDRITMAQITIWDHWKQDKRPKADPNLKGANIPTQRFKVTVELYTGDPATFGIGKNLKPTCAFKGSTNLFRHSDVGPILRNMVDVGKTITADYEAHILEIHAASTPTCCFGLLRASTGTRGRPYVEDNFIRVEMIGSVPGIADLWINGIQFPISGFTTMTSKGEPLTKMDRCDVVAQSRMDMTGTYEHKKWDSRNTNL